MGVKIRINGFLFEALPEAAGIWKCHDLGYFWLGGEDPITRESRPFFHGPYGGATECAMDRFRVLELGADPLTLEIPGDVQPLRVACEDAEDWAGEESAE